MITVLSDNDSLSIFKPESRYHCDANNVDLFADDKRLDFMLAARAGRLYRRDPDLSAYVFLFVSLEDKDYL